MGGHRVVMFSILIMNFFSNVLVNLFEAGLLLEIIIFSLSVITTFFALFHTGILSFSFIIYVLEG